MNAVKTGLPINMIKKTVTTLRNQAMVSADSSVAVYTYIMTYTVIVIVSPQYPTIHPTVPQEIPGFNVLLMNCQNEFSCTYFRVSCRYCQLHYESFITVLHIQAYLIKSSLKLLSILSL